MKWIVAIIIALVSTVIQGAKIYGPYQGDLIRVVDGDTVVLDVHIWPGLTQRTRIRLDGINAPEIRGKYSDCEKQAGQKATSFVVQWFASHPDFIVTQLKKGKFTPVARIVSGTNDLSMALLKSGHAVPYSGREKRRPWCTKHQLKSPPKIYL